MQSVYLLSWLQAGSLQLAWCWHFLLDAPSSSELLLWSDDTKDDFLPKAKQIISLLTNYSGLQLAKTSQKGYGESIPVVSHCMALTLLVKADFHRRVIFRAYARKWKRGNVWKATRKRER